MVAADAPLLATKLYVPRARSKRVSRPHLIARLNDAAERSLTLLSAPAGFGKTTLLSEWIAHSGRRVAWLSLDASDNDPVSFWSYVIAALQTLKIHLGEDALAALHSPQPPLLKSILTLLLNDIAAAPDDVILILDDYHVIDSQPLHDALTFLLDHLPLHAHVILAGRSDPPLPLARLRARGQLAEIRANALRFTPDEAVDFFNRAMGLGLSEQEIYVLDARTEGWIAGLQLAALSVQGQPAERVAAFIRAFAGSHRYIADYLMEEVLRQQPPEIDDFLLRTSILDRLCAPLCDAVVGRPDSQAMLERLERANLFLIPLDAERGWYRFHHLFADLLRSRLQQALPEEVVSLHRRASAWCAQNGLSADAIRHALAAGDAESAADLIEQSVASLRKRGEYQTLQVWLDQLPESVVFARPALCLAHASLLITLHDLDAAEPYLRKAESISRGSERESAIQGEALTLRARIAHRRTDFPLALALAGQALELIEADDRRLKGQAALVLGNASYYCDRPEAAIQAFAESSQLAESAGDLHTALNAICNQGIMQYLSGQLQRATLTYQHGLQLAADHRAERLLMAGVLHMNLALVLYEWNDLEDALDRVQKAIERCDQAVEPYFMMLCRTHLAKTLLARGNTAEASRTIQAAMQIARDHDLPHLSTVDAVECQVRLWLAQGDRAAVSAWAQASGLSVDDELSPSHEPGHTALARALVALGETDEALRLLSRLNTAAEIGGRKGVAVGLLALQAVAQQAQGDRLGALDTLAGALAFAEPAGYIRAFVDEGEPMRLLIADGRSRIVDSRVRAYADHLLDAFGAAASGGDSDANPHPFVESLTDRELEVLQLVAEGLSDRQIAEALTVVAGTVKRHLNNIYSKLGVHSRTQALARAKELKLL